MANKKWSVSAVKSEMRRLKIDGIDEVTEDTVSKYAKKIRAKLRKLKESGEEAKSLSERKGVRRTVRSSSRGKAPKTKQTKIDGDILKEEEEAIKKMMGEGTVASDLLDEKEIRKAWRSVTRSIAEKEDMEPGDVRETISFQSVKKARLSGKDPTKELRKYIRTAWEEWKLYIEE